jgi:hypothetical protein
VGSGRQSAELGLLVKLRALDSSFRPPTGLATVDQRREAVLAAITPWLDVTYTVRNGRRITMAMQFADAYGMVP